MSESLTHKLPIGETGRADSQLEELTPDKWQMRLLPLMSHMVIGLTLFFFVASFAQLAYLQLSILENPEIDLTEPLTVLSSGSDVTIDGLLAMSRYKVLATLEANALALRHHQANVLLMSRVWARYLGFATGMILVLVGSSFILGKLREAPSKVESGSSAFRFSIGSSSPGLILAGLGVVLMLTTIINHHEITVRDAPVYLRGSDQFASFAATDREMSESSLVVGAPLVHRSVSGTPIPRVRSSVSGTPVPQRDKAEVVTATPQLLSPADGSVFDHYPRTTTLRWTAVPGADRYMVQIDCFQCCAIEHWCTEAIRADYGLLEVAGTEYTFDFVGALPGRWRVWAVNAQGQAGPKSGWLEFRYTR